MKRTKTSRESGERWMLMIKWSIDFITIFLGWWFPASPPCLCNIPACPVFWEWVEFHLRQVQKKIHPSITKQSLRRCDSLKGLYLDFGDNQFKLNDIVIYCLRGVHHQMNEWMSKRTDEATKWINECITGWLTWLTNWMPLFSLEWV